MKAPITITPIISQHELQSIQDKHQHGSPNQKHHHHNSTDNDSLHALQQRQLYHRASQHLHQHPLSARTLDSHNNTLLHLALTNNTTPPWYIDALLTAHPLAVTQRNHESNLPLHIACQSLSWNLSGESILMTLIQAYPRGLLWRNEGGERPVDILRGRGVKTRDVRWGGMVMRVMLGRMLEMERQHVDDDCMDELRDDNQNDYSDDKEAEREGPQSIHHTNLDEDDTACCHHMTTWHNDTCNQETNEFHHHDDDTVTPRHRNGRHRSKKQCERRQFLKSSACKTKNHKKNREKAQFVPNAHVHRDEREELDNHDSFWNHEVEMMQQPQREQLHYTSFSYSRDSFHELHDCDDAPFHHENVSSFNSNHSSDDTETIPATVNQTNVTNTTFHHRNQELYAKHSNPQPISKVLKVKSTKESSLPSRLARLEQAHAQLKNKYHSLSVNHAKVTNHSKDMERRLADKTHELQVLKTKEDALSAELAMRLGKEEKQQCELREVKDRRKEESQKLALVQQELEEKKRTLFKAQEENEELTAMNQELAQQLAVAATEKQSLLQENSSLKMKLSSKEKELVETKTKETSLCDQLISKLALMEIQEKKSLELEAQWKEERETNLELQHQINLVEKKSSNDAIILNNMRTESTELQNLLWEEQTKNRNLQDELASMRQKVQAAKEGLAYLQRSKGILKDTAEEKVDKMGEPINKTRQIHPCSPEESIELLPPIIQDVLDIQHDTIQRIYELLHKTTNTKQIIQHISETSTPDNFSFQSTLQLLETILTRHIQIGKDLDDAFHFEETCQSKLSSLFGISFEQVQNTNTDSNITSSSESDSLISQRRFKELSAASRSHTKKIQSLYNMAMELQPINVQLGDTKSNAENKHVPLHVANEVVSIFQEAMAALLEDTKHLVLFDD